MPSIARPCEWFFGRGPRAGPTSSGTSSRRTRSAVRISREVWSDRIDDPRTGRPIGSGPFLVERLERGRQLVLRRNPRYWGPHPAYVERLVIRFAESATDPSEELRSGELDVAMGVPPAVVPAVRRLPGMRLVAPAGVQFRAPRHPARTERSPGASQQARSPCARVRDRPPRARPADMGRGRSLRSRARQRRASGPEPLLRAELERVPLSTGGGPPPARASRLPQRSGRDLLLRREAALVALRDDRRGFVRAQALPLIQAQLRAAGVEVVPVFAAPRGVLRPDPPAGDVRRRTLLVGRLTGCIVGRRLRLRRSRRTSPATASGSSPPTSTRPTGSSTSVDTPVSSTEPTGGSRVTSRRSRSSSSSPRPRTTPLSGTSSFLPWNPLWNAENWWLGS